MSVLDCARLIIYRVNKKGLEIFMVNTGEENWELPMGFAEKVTKYTVSDEDFHVIPLDSILNKEGLEEKVFAIEGDWHDIPSIRGMIQEDAHIVKEHVKDQLVKVLPGLENGAFMAFKEAFKKVLPGEYAMLKELKEIITDKNLMKSI